MAISALWFVDPWLAIGVAHGLHRPMTVCACDTSLYVDIALAQCLDARVTGVAFVRESQLVDPCRMAHVHGGRHVLDAGHTVGAERRVGMALGTQHRALVHEVGFMHLVVLPQDVQLNFVFLT